MPDRANPFHPQGGAFKDGWSKSGYLATGGVVIAAPGNNRTTQSISTQAKFEKTEGGPGAQYFTMQFGIQRPPSGFFFAYADVVWTTEGNDVRRRISIVNGAVISGTAEYAKVTLFDGTPELLNVTPEAYYVNVLITPGARPSTQQPPRLVVQEENNSSGTPGFYQVIAESSIRVPINQDFGIISLNSIAQVLGAPSTPIVAGDITLQFLISSVNATVGEVDLFPIMGTWIPIPPGADLLKIINNRTAPDDILINAVFGVEG
jgi:hypothetical protein